MITNRQLILPYAAPYLAYVGIASLPDHLVSIEVSYALRLILIPLLLLWGWRWYCSLSGPRSWRGSVAVGIAAGLVGLLVWIGLLAPFVAPDGATPWSTSGFALRLLSAGLLVPLFEELMMRGYALRLALQWDQARKQGDREALHTVLDNRSINDVAPGEWTWSAVLLSTIAFTAGHTLPEWPASIAYGLGMAWLWITRKDLIACIVAHATTNIALAIFVYSTGSWHFW